MHFKHPEILYFLFLLVIPVLVHLFQLRRFRTEKFTNVKFLKKAVLQTRKSSRIKKWLILFTRLLLLASIVTAFAQPYFIPEEGVVRSQETVIYLDNSYSMQAKGKKGVLLKRAVQELLETLPAEGEISFLTNNEEYKNLDAASLREKLQHLDYSPSQLNWKTVALKAENLSSEAPDIQKNFIAISDFQKKGTENEIKAIESINTYLVSLKPENTNNVAIDSAFVFSKDLDEIKLTVILKTSGEAQQEVPVSLYNGMNLLAKKTVSLENDKVNTVFTLPAGPVKKGRISINDNSLQFDNELFFSINETDPVSVVVIGSSDTSYLTRIYTEPEFELNIYPENAVDFNKLVSANLVILNEPENISSPLANEISKLQQEKTLLIVIPSESADIQSYNSFFRKVGMPVFTEKVQQEKLITDIIYEHPLYESVFDEKVSNFQYPKVQSYYLINGSGSRVLEYENGQAFLYEKDNIFVFTAPINLKNSNFQGAPLIVPTFYNIGNLAISPSQLYFALGKSQRINMKAQLGQDEILKLSSLEATYIPRQQSFQNKVEIYLDEVPETEGHYEVLKDSSRLKTLSFNLDRSESRLNYMELKPSENIKIESSIPEVFEEIQTAGKVDELWKWFVIFALIFLLTEMLILKYFK